MATQLKLNLSLPSSHLPWVYTTLPQIRRESLFSHWTFSICNMESFPFFSNFEYQSLPFPPTSFKIIAIFTSHTFNVHYHLGNSMYIHLHHFQIICSLFVGDFYSCSILAHKPNSGLTPKWCTPTFQNFWGNIYKCQQFPLQTRHQWMES